MIQNRDPAKNPPELSPAAGTESRLCYDALPGTPGSPALGSYSMYADAISMTRPPILINLPTLSRAQNSQA